MPDADRAASGGMELPASLVSADRAAVSAQALTRRVHATELSALVLAALAGVTAWRLGRTELDGLAAVGTLAFGVAVLAAIFRDSRHPQSDWVKARAVTESIRAAAWRYAVGGEPFPPRTARADEAFLRHVEAALDTVQDLTLPIGPPGKAEISDGMRELRGSPLERRKAAYLRGRLDDQIGYYTDRARANDRRRRLWFRVVLSADLAGLLGGALRFADVVDVDLVGIAAAVAGAAVAWTQLNQHRTLATAYSQTLRQLVLARDRLAVVGDDDWPEYVDSVEDVMAREHSVWLTKRATPGLGA